MRKPHEILGVQENATVDEIKAAYKRMSRKYHPDKHGGDRDAEGIFKDINEAYETMVAPDRRQEHHKQNEARNPYYEQPFTEDSLAKRLFIIFAVLLFIALAVSGVVYLWFHSAAIFSAIKKVVWMFGAGLVLVIMIAFPVERKRRRRR